MTSSTDGESEEKCGLTVVSGSHASSNSPANDTLDKVTSGKLAVLRQQHRELDEEILAIITAGAHDQLHLTRLKKRKLMLRDQISRIEDDCVPDIIA
ncbi:MAG: YdcH family protein [Alphaproteobacteria bacterium]|nr:YdcH family protein [Alphaproteobacteria bacterium]